LSLLIAIDRKGKLINYQFALTENSYWWTKLFNKINKPAVIVSDGQNGILKAIKKCYKDTFIQRCQLHIIKNIKTKLTNNPTTDAGIQLLKITKQLSKIKKIKQAIRWFKVLNNWHNEYTNLLREKTINDNYIKGINKKWWYTHQRLRSSYYQLEKLNKNNQLFVYLNQILKTRIGIIPNTSNKIEGGINAQIRRLLGFHRGMSLRHQMRIIEWFLIDKFT
jgi:transposase-like protein